MPKNIIIHHTESLTSPTNRQFTTVNNLHRNLFGMKSSLGYWCGYHYFIEVNGDVIKAREDTDMGAHTMGRNKDSIGICLAGKFDTQMPTDEQIQALKTLLLEKMKQWSIPAKNIKLHRYWATTSMRDGKFIKNTTKYATWDGCLPYKSCAGSLLPDNWGELLVAPPPGTVATEDVEKALSILERIVQLLKNYLTQRRALGMSPYDRHDAE